MSKTNIGKAMANPSAYFKSPKDVLKTENISTGQKELILKNWLQQCLQLLKADDEGMTKQSETQNSDSLTAISSSINQALRELSRSLKKECL